MTVSSLSDKNDWPSPLLDSPWGMKFFGYSIQVENLVLQYSEKSFGLTLISVSLTSESGLGTDDTASFALDVWDSFSTF